jgi:FMN phosphatase YigB (HAD superfamily)
VRPRIGQVLFDFDGVLAVYRRERRLAHLAVVAGTDASRVREALYGSGLEARYDAGQLDTSGYLQELGERLGHPVDERTWLAARVAASQADPQVVARVAALDSTLALGVLTNNGVLIGQAIPDILPGLYPRLQGRVLCSGQFGRRKPDPLVFVQALERLCWDPVTTLFVDDLFANVQGARKAGLQADTVKDARSLRRVLKRYGLVGAPASIANGLP